MKCPISVYRIVEGSPGWLYVQVLAATSMALLLGRKLSSCVQKHMKLVIQDELQVAKSIC